jgi:hypothetical protein
VCPGKSRIENAHRKTLPVNENWTPDTKTASTDCVYTFTVSIDLNSPRIKGVNLGPGRANPVIEMGRTDGEKKNKTKTGSRMKSC